MIDANTLLNAYALGIFPMADDKEGPIHWYEPRLRGIIPMQSFKVSKNVQRMIRNQHYRAGVNQAFEAVIWACADRPESWISEEIIKSYVNLHQLGFAASVEVYEPGSGKLVGGLYGVIIRQAFFGESMFKRRAEADKIALWHCHQWLQQQGVTFWDTQFWTKHLAQFGCTEISQEAYLERLEEALFGNSVNE